MTRAARLPLLATLGCAVLLVACGGGAPAGSPTPAGATNTPPAASATPAAATPTGATPTDAPAGSLCALVDQATAADALGEAVDGGTPDQSVLTGATSCVYQATGSNNWLKVELHQDADRGEWETALGKIDVTEPVEGVGDAAFRYSGSSGTKISAFEGDHYIWVVVNKAGGDNATFEAKTEAIARALLEGL